MPKIFLIKYHMILRKSARRPINQSKTTDQYVNKSRGQTQTKKKVEKKK